MKKEHKHKHKWYTFGCKDATFLMAKSPFSALTFFEKALVVFHILICKYCRRFKTQTKNISSFFKGNSVKNAIELSVEKKEAMNQLITKNLK